MKYVFTFGSAHHTVDNTSLAGRYCEVEAATREDARTLMFIARNTAWAFDYPNQEAAGVDKWALRPIDFSQVSLLEPADTAVVEKLRQSGFRFQRTVFKEDDGWYAWLPDPTLRRCQGNADKMQAIGVQAGRSTPTMRCQYEMSICGKSRYWHKLTAFSLTAEDLLKDYEHLKRTLSDAWNAVEAGDSDAALARKIRELLHDHECDTKFGMPQRDSSLDDWCAEYDRAHPGRFPPTPDDRVS